MEVVLNRVEEFLDLYRTLEGDLKEFYSGRRLKSSSLIFEYMNEEGKRHYDELDLCREVRNLLSHHSYFAGECPITPSESLIEALRGVIHEIENPVTASVIATPLDSLLTAAESDSVPYLLEKMEKRGFSHVPVVKNESLIGVFSVGAVFDFVKSRPGTVVDNGLRLFDMHDFLLIDAHRAEQYAFCTAKTALSDISAIFKSAGPKKRRVAAVFVLKNSDPRSALRGMITPWDVIKTQD